MVILFLGADVNAGPKADAILIELGSGPGGCATSTSCKEYCSLNENKLECYEFAEEHNLIPEDKKIVLKKFSNITGPNGCIGFECRIACKKEENHEACIELAQKHKLVKEERLEKFQEAKKIREIKRQEKQKLREEREFEKIIKLENMRVESKKVEENRVGESSDNGVIRKPEVTRPPSFINITPHHIKPLPTHNSSEIIRKNGQQDIIRKNNEQNIIRRSTGGLFYETLRDFFKF